METSSAVMPIPSYLPIYRLGTLLAHRNCATLRSRLRLTTSLKSIALLMMLYLAPAEAMVCPSRAHGELGKPVVLSCELGDFKSVHWYNATRMNESPVAILKEDNSKTGKGLSSGQYDITDNGNLVIRNATVADERMYRVVVLDEANDHRTFDIHLVMYANTDAIVPTVSVCGDVGLCRLVNPMKDPVICSVQNVRPAASLTWSILHPNSSRADIGHEDVIPSQGLFSTYSSLNMTSTKRSRFQIYVCKSARQLLSYETNSAVLLVENTFPIVSNRNIKTRYHNYFSRINLKCSSEAVRYAIWKRRTGYQIHDTIAYLAMGKSEVLHSEYELGADGQLIVKNFSVSEEGDYVCIYVKEDDEEEEERKRFHRIKTLKMPFKQHPDIIGCFDETNCTFATKEATGFLTCHLTGVLPINHLKWHVDTPSSTEVIEINLLEPDLKDDGPFYDIYQTVHYEFLSHQPITDVNISCHVRYPNNKGYRTQATITFWADGEGMILPGEQSPEVPKDRQVDHILVILSAALMACLVANVIFLNCQQRWKKTETKRDDAHVSGVNADIMQL